jgi:hypothetical protein
MKNRQHISLILVFCLSFQLFLAPVLLADEATFDPEKRPFGDFLESIEAGDNLDEMIPPRELAIGFLEDNGGLSKKDIVERAWRGWFDILGNSYLYMSREARQVFSLELLLKKMISSKDFRDNMHPTIAFGFKTLSHGLGAIGGKLQMLKGFDIIRNPTAAKLFAQMAESLGAKYSLYKDSAEAAIAKMKATGVLKGVGIDVDGIPSTAKYLHAWKKGAQLAQKVADYGGAFTEMAGPVFAIMSAYYDHKELSEKPEYFVRQGGFDAYLQVAGITFGLLSLVGGLLIPPAGTMIAVGGIIIYLIKEGKKIIEDWHKKKLVAYTDSYRFLMDCDPAFSFFAKNFKSLSDKPKSSLWEWFENSPYKDVIKGEIDQVVSSGQAPAIAALDALRKQAVLNSYYDKGDNPHPHLSYEEFKKLWFDKLDYMKWRPTEKDLADEKKDREEWEKTKKDGTWWQKIYGGGGNVVKWAWDEVTSIPSTIGQLYNSIGLGKQPWMFYNPDFVLQKWYDQSRIGKTPNRIIMSRIEGAPFHYLPLLEIPVQEWDDETLSKAFLCDQYLCTLKTMIALKTTIEALSSELETRINSMRNVLDDFAHKTLPAMARRVAALNYLAVSLNSKEGRKRKDLGMWNRFAQGFPEDIPQNVPDENKTAEYLATECKEVIEKNMRVLPLLIGTLQAELSAYYDHVRHQDCISQIADYWFETVQKEVAEMEGKIGNTAEGSHTEAFTNFLFSGLYHGESVGFTVESPKTLFSNLFQCFRYTQDGALQCVFDTKGTLPKFKEIISLAKKIDFAAAQPFRDAFFGGIVPPVRNDQYNLEYFSNYRLRLYEMMGALSTTVWHFSRTDEIDVPWQDSDEFRKKMMGDFINVWDNKNPPSTLTAPDCEVMEGFDQNLKKYVIDEQVGAAPSGGSGAESAEDGSPE